MIFSFLSAVLLKVQVFWDVTPCPLVNTVKPRYRATVVLIALSGLAVGRRIILPATMGLNSQSRVSECLVLKIMTPNSSETLTVDQGTWHNSPEEQNFQNSRYCCENLMKHT